MCVLSLSPHACYALIPSEFLVAGGGVRWGGVWGGERRGSDLALEGILVSHPLWYAKLTSGFWKDSLYTHTVRRLMFLHTPQPHPHHQISARAAYRQTLLLALGMCSDTLSALTQHHLVRSLKASLVFPLSRRLSIYYFFSGGGPGFLSDGLAENERHVNSTTRPHPGSAAWISSADNEVICLRVARSPTKAGIH